MNKMIIEVVIGGVVLAGGSFYGGMKYARSRDGNLSQADRQARFAEGGFQGPNGARGARGAGAAGFTAGEILSVDGQSLTVKLPDGGSRIVLFSTSTPIEKSSNGERADLKEGENVTVAGQMNQDGSVTAQRISIGGRAFSPQSENTPR